jgi:transposase
MLTQAQDNEEIIARVAALDIGKAELACCVRVPDEDRPGRRLQEAETYSTMTGRCFPWPATCAAWGCPGW